MDGFVTAGAPATALGHAGGVIYSADQDGGTILDLLKMAFQAQVGIPFGEHPGVDGAVRRMAGGAASAQGFVLKHKRPLLGRMALEAVFLLRQQLRAAADMGDAFVRRMALDASHPAFGHGMMAGQIELAAHVQVTLITNRLNGPRRGQRQPRAQSVGLRTTSSEAVRRLGFAAGIRVDAGRTMAGFATVVVTIFAEGQKPCVVGGLEAAADFLVTLFTFAGADVFCPRHFRQNDGVTRGGAARNYGQQHDARSDGQRQVARRPAARP